MKSRALKPFELALKNAFEESDKVDYLIRIAEAFYDSGYKEEARVIFRKALNMALSIDRKLTSKIIESLINRKEFELALDILNNINISLHDHLSRIAIDSYKYDRNDELLDRIFKLVENKQKLLKFIKSLIWKGGIRDLKNSEKFKSLLNKCLDTAKNLGNQEILKYIAMSYAIMGEFDKALAIAEDINDAKYKFDAKAYIAYRLAKVGLEKEATSIVESIIDGLTTSKHANTYCYLALYYIRLDKLNKVMDILKLSNIFKEIEGEIKSERMTWRIWFANGIRLDISHITRIILELADVNKFELATKIIVSYGPSLAFSIVKPWVDPDYDNRNFIEKLLESDLNDSKKLELINKIYNLLKTRLEIAIMVDDIGGIDTQSKMLNMLSKLIAYHSLKPLIVERAKYFEEMGEIKKANELYEIIKW